MCEYTLCDHYKHFCLCMGNCYNNTPTSPPPPPPLFALHTPHGLGGCVTLNVGGGGIHDNNVYNKRVRVSS